MGYTRSSSTDWARYSSTTSTKTRAEIFTKKSLDDDLNPLDVGIRESRDSDANPESNAIIVALDVTGSMGMLAENIAKKGMSTLFTEIYARKPVTDPHIMSMAVGDPYMWDEAPIQVSQFESEVDLTTKWLEKLYIEGNGGGNAFEGYDMPYYFARYHTSIDCFEKRNEKGFLFTIGDEPPPPVTTVKAIKEFISSDGDGLQADIPFEKLIEETQKMYHCFHIMIAEGSHAQYHPDNVKNGWRALLGQNAVWLKDYNDLAETIISIIQVTKGADKAEVAASWDGSTALVVKDAIKDLKAADAYDAAKGVVRL